MYLGTIYSSLFCQSTIITCDMQTLLRVREGIAVHGRLSPLRVHSDRRSRFIPDAGNMRERQDRTCWPTLPSGEALLALRTVPAQQSVAGSVYNMECADSRQLAASGNLPVAQQSRCSLPV